MGGASAAPCGLLIIAAVFAPNSVEQREACAQVVIEQDTCAVQKIFEVFDEMRRTIEHIRRYALQKRRTCPPYLCKADESGVLAARRGSVKNHVTWQGVAISRNHKAVF